MTISRITLKIRYILVADYLLFAIIRKMAFNTLSKRPDKQSQTKYEFGGDIHVYIVAKAPGLLGILRIYFSKKLFKN